MRIGLKELPLLKYSRSIQRYAKRYWVKDFGVEDIVCTISGNVTNEVIMNYIENHFGD